MEVSTMFLGVALHCPGQVWYSVEALQAVEKAERVKFVLDRGILNENFLILSGNTIDMCEAGNYLPASLFHI